MSLKRCESFKIPSIVSGVITPNLLEYGSPTIFHVQLGLGEMRTLDGIQIYVLNVLQVFLDC